MVKLMDKYVSRGRRTASRILDGTAIVLLLPRDNTDKKDPTFELGPAGAYLWELLEKDPKVKTIVSCFIKKYSLERQEAIEQVTGFITKLKKDDLVEIKDRRDNKGKPWLK